jgi:predicted helicase
MQNFINGKNVGLNWIRPMSAKYEFSIFISQYITDQCSAGNKSAGAGISYLGPLYLYSKTSGQQTIEQSEERTPNLNAEIVNLIAEKLALTFTNEKEETKGTFAPIDVLDYIYAVLHSPTYREKYKEFLKIDFPRVPYPENQDTFWKLVRLGGEIRQIHLLESPTVEQYITQYPIAGDNLVSRKMSKNSPGYVPNNETHGKVYINDEQYFDNVPLLAWEFYIGGYQPAQKWLKDRKGRKLEWEDIAHYQKIIVALTETNRIMKEINETYNLNN